MLTKLLLTLKRYALILLVGYIILITILSLISLTNMPAIGLGFEDKIYHAFAYSVFVVLCFNYLTQISEKSATLKAIIFSIGYGIIIEVLQKVLNTNRTFDLWDIVANIVGVLFGYIIILLINKLKLN